MNIIHKEITLKITLTGIPVSRVILVPDSISLIELYALITFLFEWDKMRNHAFRFKREGNWVALTSKTTLAQLHLLPGEKIGFVYDYPAGKCWEHKIEVLFLQDLPKPLKDYVPTCTSTEYASPGENMRDLQSLKANWTEFSDKSAPELWLIDDSHSFFWNFRSSGIY